MKKMLLISVIIACLAMLTACYGPDGAAGKAYIELTYDSLTSYGNAVDGWIADNGGFPSSFTDSTEYEVSAGTYTLDWVLFDDWWDGWYNTYFNDPYSPLIYNSYSYATNHTYFINNYFAAYANALTYTITVNPGGAGQPFFQAGADGADTHFTIYLDWVRTSSGISSNRVPASEAKIIEDSSDRVVKELTDGNYTLRIEIKKPPELMKSGQIQVP